MLSTAVAGHAALAGFLQRIEQDAQGFVVVEVAFFSGSEQRGHAAGVCTVASQFLFEAADFMFGVLQLLLPGGQFFVEIADVVLDRTGTG